LTNQTGPATGGGLHVEDAGADADANLLRYAVRPSELGAAFANISGDDVTIGVR